MTLQGAMHALLCGCAACREAEKVRDLVRKDGRYQLDAIGHVYESFHLAALKLQKAGDDGSDLGADKIVKAVGELADERFGTLRHMVFDLWGVRHSRDVGEIVRMLCGFKHLRQGPHDRFEDFEELDVSFVRKKS